MVSVLQLYLNLFYKLRLVHWINSSLNTRIWTEIHVYKTNRLYCTTALSDVIGLLYLEEGVRCWGIALSLYTRLWRTSDFESSDEPNWFPLSRWNQAEVDANPRPRFKAPLEPPMFSGEPPIVHKCRGPDVSCSNDSNISIRSLDWEDSWPATQTFSQCAKHQGQSRTLLTLQRALIEVVRDPKGGTVLQRRIWVCATVGARFPPIALALAGRLKPKIWARPGLVGDPNST